MLSVATAAIFGLGPARQASKMDLGTALWGLRPYASLRETRLRRRTGGHGIALALVLLVGAGLLTRAFGRLLQGSWFLARGLATSWMLAPPATYRTRGRSACSSGRGTPWHGAGSPSVALGSAGPLFGGVGRER